MNRTAITIVACMGLALSACVSKAQALRPGAENVQILRGDPPTGLKDLGTVEIEDGFGCGGDVFQKGTYEAAMAKLKNETVKRGGTMARIDFQQPPVQRPGCYDMRYIINATIYTDGTDLAEASRWPVPGPNGEVTCEGERSSDRLVWATPGACDSYAEMTRDDPEFAKGMAERRRAEMEAGK